MRRLENRIFFIAIAASIALHLFWIFTVKIVAGTSRGEPVKFSRVSFLGPASGMGDVELAVAPKTASFLEERYRRRTAEMPASGVENSGILLDRSREEEATLPRKDDAMAHLIERALDSSKLEP